MKKILTLFLVSLIFVCTACGKMSAKDAVSDYLKKYKTLDSEVLLDLENIIKKENLTDSEEEKYREVLKKQYKDLSFEIIDEEYDGDNAYVTVKIAVYDLYKAQNDASEYLKENRDEFNDENGNYSVSKYMEYRLDKMKEMNDRIEYTLTFTVQKNKDQYEVMQPTENDLLKIHGIYDYTLS